LRKQRLRKVKQKTEFSKLILIAVSIAVTIVIVFSMVMMWRTNDLSPISYILGGLFVELATATGFYYNKAKAENIIKLGGNIDGNEFDS